MTNTPPQKQPLLATAWWQLIRLGFHLLYNQLAWTYDVVSWLVSLGEWRAWQFTALPYVRGERVLEIAHGTGHLLHELRKLAPTVVGLDLSPHMGRIAQRRLRQQGLGLPLIRGSAQRLPFAASQFDTVITTFPTPFIVESATLNEIHAVLAPEGRLVIVPSGQLTGSGKLHQFIQWLFVITGQADGDGGGSAESVYQPWLDQFNACGFSATIHIVRRPRSFAHVIVATKLTVN